MKFGLITGLPRSGTTLAAALVDQCNDAFCMSEPEDHVTLLGRSSSPHQFVSLLIETMKNAHYALRNGETVNTRLHKDGLPLTNYFTSSETGIRQATYSSAAVARPGLSRNFLLCSKHNALYTAVLPELVKSDVFRIVAVIRDPIATITSWQSLDLPISRGRLPAGERYWPKLCQIAESEQPILHKQIMIFELLCRRYSDYESAIRIIRYEDMVADQSTIGAAFGAASSPRTAAKANSLIDKPRSARPSETLLQALKILSSQGLLSSLSKFYPAALTP